MAAHVMIHIRPEDIPEQGLAVVYRCGECFERQIEWGESSEGLLQASADCNDQHEPGLTIDDLPGQGFAGYEPRTGNYWRYQQDADPEVYREHCMQILEIKAPFVPPSSWSAWEPRNLLVTKDLLRLTLKNQVTCAELRYKLVNNGFGYQIKDLSRGRRVQQLLKHDYILNKALGCSYKHLNYHKVNIETEAFKDEDGGTFTLRFEEDGYMLRYSIDNYELSIGVFSTRTETMELLKLIELPHSSMVGDRCCFI